MIDIFIAHATIITVDSLRRVIVDGAIAIDKGTIIEIGKFIDLRDKFQARTILDASGHIAMPGMINGHMHLPQVIMRGMHDDIAPMDKLKNYVWPIQGNFDSGDALASTKLGLLEMIKSGTTAFLGTGLHPRYGIDGIAQAILDSGIRGVISKYVMDVTGYALDHSALHAGMQETGEDSIAQAKEMISNWNGAGSGRLQAWLSPRSVGGCSVELLQKVVSLGQEFGIGITAHWAEVKNNVEYTKETHDMLPVEFAESVGLLGPNVTFAHGIYLEDKEIELLAKSSTNICHCPVCNAKMAMGVAKVPQMLHIGVNVCLGNDGMPVNNTADMFREMRSSLLIHRNNECDPLYPTAVEAIEMATINGARALMIEDSVGSLESGKRADIILVDSNKPHMWPIHDPVSAIVWAANGNDVKTVLIDGVIVMENRNMLTLDEDQILSDAQARKNKILEQADLEANHVWKLI